MIVIMVSLGSKILLFKDFTGVVVHINNLAAFFHKMYKAVL